MSAYLGTQVLSKSEHLARTRYIHISHDFSLLLQDQQTWQIQPTGFCFTLGSSLGFYQNSTELLTRNIRPTANSFWD